MRKLALLMVLVSSGCGAPEHAREAATGGGVLDVYVVNYPLQYFAERIAGSHAEVSFPAPHDIDPALWSPDSETIAAYQRADVILLNGASYAKWVDRVTLPESRVVDTSAGFRDLYVINEDAVVHSHGPEGEHSHGETAFTTWIDPMLAIEHAKAIRDALASVRPEHEASFQRGFVELERDLLALDARLEEATAGTPETPLVGSHPVYQYLARRYRLNLRSVHFEPDAFPNDGSWDELSHLLEEHPARVMLWENEPTPDTAARLKAMGIASVVFNPCGNRPDSGDYRSVMEENVTAIENIFSTR